MYEIKRYSLINAWLPIVWFFLLACPSAVSAAGKDRTLEVEGKVFYKVTRSVKNEYEGTIDTLKVALNDPVKEGQVLATYTLDSYVWNKLKESISPAAINRLALNVEEIRANIDVKQRDLEADLVLLKEGMASQVSVDSKEVALALLKDKLRYAQEELRIKKHELKLERERIARALGGVDLSAQLPRTAQLVSPLDGNVILTLDEQTRDLREQTTCFIIADTKKIFVNARVYVDDYQRLSAGMKATITSKTDPKTYQAVITSLPLTPVDRQYASMSYYNVELDIDDPDCTYREGNSVTITFLLDSVADAAQ